MFPRDLENCGELPVKRAGGVENARYILNGNSLFSITGMFFVTWLGLQVINYNPSFYGLVMVSVIYGPFNLTQDSMRKGSRVITKRGYIFEKNLSNHNIFNNFICISGK